MGDPMSTFQAFESMAGFAALALALLAFKPLLALYRREPRPAFIRGEMTSELVLLGYLYLLVLGLALGVHGLLSGGA